MFDNIGAKIKTLAKILCGIGTVFSVVSAFVLLSETETESAALLVFFLGPLISWVSSFLLYGFGQLVENSDVVAEQNEEILRRLKAEPKTPFASKDQPSIPMVSAAPQGGQVRHRWRCGLCGSMTDSEVCPTCDRELYETMETLKQKREQNLLSEEEYRKQIVALKQKAFHHEA